MTRLLRLESVTDATGFRKTKLYALIKQGRFPSPIRIDGASLWPESEVAGWIQQQIDTAPRGIAPVASLHGGARR